LIFSGLDSAGDECERAAKAPVIIVYCGISGLMMAGVGIVLAVTGFAGLLGVAVLFAERRTGKG